MVLLLHLNTSIDNLLSKEFASTRYSEITLRIDNVGRFFNCFRLRWATNDKVDQSVALSPSLTDAIKAVETYGVVPFSSLTSD